MKRTITDFFCLQPKKRQPNPLSLRQLPNPLNLRQLQRSNQQHQPVLHQWNQPILRMTARVMTLVLSSGRRCLTWKKCAFLRSRGVRLQVFNGHTPNAKTGAILDKDILVLNILPENTTCFRTPCPKRGFFAVPAPFLRPTKLEE